MFEKIFTDIYYFLLIAAIFIGSLIMLAISLFLFRWMFKPLNNFTERQTEYSKLRAIGEAGTAKVLVIQKTGYKFKKVPEYKIKLWIQSQARLAYQAETFAFIKYSNLSQVEVEKVVSVKIDPDDPQNVVINSDFVEFLEL